MKLGSLFDGSGGFPLAAQLCGIEPVWAAEIEPFPIAVTRKRFPNMKHLGDVSAINGAEIEPVDIITFGSPCQDLSVAGKRAGLDGERSGLFMEAMRIIKEMREATDGRYPNYAIWENVPGAFSSAKGEDFRAVLQAFGGKAYTVVAKGPGAVCYPINTMVATRGGADDGRTTFGVGEDGEPQFTISAAHSHAVCYAVDCHNGKLQEVNGTLQAKPNGGSSLNLNNVVLIPCKIILRRFTPTECARLQGMLDWWVDGIENPNPTEDDMRFWREVFETHRRIVTGASKPKTDKQIRKWLANPHSDSAEYKMWGNGVALPCVMYVMEGISQKQE